MNFKTIATVILSLMIATPVMAQTRAVGQTEPTSNPAILEIRYEGQHVCLGTLIGESLMLTAAHCVAGLGVPTSALTVETPQGTAIIQRTTTDFAWTYGRISADIALAVVRIPNNGLTKAVGGPSMNIADAAPGYSGFGYAYGRQNGTLVRFGVKIPNRAWCQNALNEANIGDLVTVDTMCMMSAQENASISPGDSGGPVVNSRGELFAINIGTKAGNPVDGPQYLVNVSMLRGWINEAMAYMDVVEHTLRSGIYAADPDYRNGAGMAWSINAKAGRLFIIESGYASNGQPVWYYTLALRISRGTYSGFRRVCTKSGLSATDAASCPTVSDVEDMFSVTAPERLTLVNMKTGEINGLHMFTDF